MVHSFFEPSNFITRCAVPRLPEISNSSSSDTYTGPLVSDDCDCWTYVGPPSSMRTKGWQVGAMARYREAPPVMRVYKNAPDSTEFCLHLKRDNDHLEGVALPVLFVSANAAPSLFKPFTLRRVVPSSPPPCLCGRLQAPPRTASFSTPSFVRRGRETSLPVTRRLSRSGPSGSLHGCTHTSSMS